MATDAERIDLTLHDGEGFVLVQPQRDRVRLVVSLAPGGEFDVSLSHEEAGQLADALGRAAEVTQ